MYLLSINCISVSLAFKNWKGKIKVCKVNKKTALVNTSCHTLVLQVLPSREQTLAGEKTAIKHRKGLVSNTLFLLKDAPQSPQKAYTTGTIIFR